MKIRNGFVSNSSSSSFVLMTTKENHERAIAVVDEYTRDVVNSIIETGKFAGRNIVYVGDLNPNDYSYLWEDFDNSIGGKYTGDSPDGHEYSGHKAFYTYKDEVKKNPDEVFNWSMG